MLSLCGRHMNVVSLLVWEKCEYGKLTLWETGELDKFICAEDT